ncbi:hypothetical protein JXB12_00035 [candidate division KSB1 bacterium]|nr:hypothetical protein [candidate division KSB1 bacterium]
MEKLNALELLKLPSEFGLILLLLALALFLAPYLAGVRIKDFEIPRLPISRKAQIIIGPLVILFVIGLHFPCFNEKVIIKFIPDDLYISISNWSPTTKVNVTAQAITGTAMLTKDAKLVGPPDFHRLDYFHQEPGVEITTEIKNVTISSPIISPENPNAIITLEFTTAFFVVDRLYRGYAKELYIGNKFGELKVNIEYKVGNKTKSDTVRISMKLGN